MMPKLLKKTDANSKKKRGGLLAAGTFVVDYHKVVERYPEERTSTRVKREVVSNGGAPLNLLLCLAKLKVEFSLHAAAVVGTDLDGKFIVDQCQEAGIDISQIRPVEEKSTGYTDVYTVESTGKHTCFHFCGIGDTFSRKDVKLRAIEPEVLFLGSLGALGKMDKMNSEYGRTGATQLLRDAHRQKITSVVEIAPMDAKAKLADYKEALSQADYLLINDRVTEKLVGHDLYSENQFDPELARQAGEALLSTGLREAVVIHSGSAAIYIGADGTVEYQSGFFLPRAQRAGSAGVDHAFAAGFIEALYEKRPVKVMLKQGLAISTVCRRGLTPSESILPLEDCLDYCKRLTT